MRAAPVAECSGLRKMYGVGDVAVTAPVDGDLGVGQPASPRRSTGGFVLHYFNPIAMAIGADPLTPAGIYRWAREATSVYAEGEFRARRKE